MRDLESPRSLVYLSLSNSVGGAILTGGALYGGDHLRAGEFGHNTLVPDGRPCYCGKKGCLDAYCPAKVLSQLTDGNLALFFDGLRSGNAALQTAWNEYLSYLAVAVNNLRMTFDCDVIVGGYVGGFLAEFGEPLREMLVERNTFAAGQFLPEVQPLIAGSLCAGSRSAPYRSLYSEPINLPIEDGTCRPRFFAQFRRFFLVQFSESAKKGLTLVVRCVNL